MQAYFKLRNDILDCGLTPNKLKVAMCLYSCVFKSCYIVKIKQKTIAEKCGIKKLETVANIICSLQRKGIIQSVSRRQKANGLLGTYIYRLKTIPSKGYFKVKRYILGKLSNVQLRMYLFICRCLTKKNDMWNSFNDIARALQIGRGKVISTINELVQLGFIRKLRILKSDGSYSDNHYSISEPEQLIKKEESPEQATTPFGTFKINNYSSNYRRCMAICQVKFNSLFDFFSGVVP